MTAHPSLTTSRLAALSLSPSRIAQLGVKHDSPRVDDAEDGDAVSFDRRHKDKQPPSDSVDDKNYPGDGSEGMKHASLTVPRPDVSRRSSTLDSLSDEGEDVDGFAVGTEDTGSPGDRDVHGGSGKERAVSELERIRDAPASNPSEQSPVPSTIPITAAGSSRQRSPPPSYEHAILPSALHQSSLSPLRNDRAQEQESSQPMSARRRGKQRDMGDSGRDGGVVRGSGGGGMLELLPNSDTSDGEEVFLRQTAGSSSPPTRRREEPSHTPRQDRPQAVLLASHLGKPSSVRRKRPPILTTTRARSSYTGPVEMIDRSGEGWAESMVNEDDDTGTETGYDMTPDGETPVRPAFLSGTSSFIRALPSPSSGAFTKDARILGWKIVGGRTKSVQHRADEGGHDSGVEELEKPRLGAYVGTYPFYTLARPF